MKTKPNHKFIKESLFFPTQKILVIGDLHLGYDFMLRKSGILLPGRQIKNVIKRLRKIFDIIQTDGKEVEKIIFLGDIKHSFGYEFKERDDLDEIIDFLRTKVDDENIILIKGNHDTMDYSKNKKMKLYHIEKDIAFAHGHKTYIEIFDKSIKTIVLGHLHPSVILEEKPGVKRETYKCFLTGKYKGKEIIFLPSFLGIVEGSSINSGFGKEDFSIIPERKIRNFNVHIVGKDKAYDFGKVKEM